MANEQFMLRAIELAKQGEGFVWSNPLVGAVLVHDGRIIGEGYHKNYGGAHAEINCLDSIAAEDRPLISSSTMYVTLEPCSHHGKTPPCAERLIREGVKKVVIGAADPSEKINGKGIAWLQTAGIEVEVGMLEEECSQVARHFFHFYTTGRPFVTLKWAQSADAFIGEINKGNKAVSGELSKRFTHRLRACHMGIMVGYRTALLDDPSLTVRYANGRSPVRIVVDPLLDLPLGLKIFIDGNPTIVLHNKGALAESKKYGNKVSLIAVDGKGKNIKAILEALAKEGIQSLLVEGGASLLRAFIDGGLFNEALIITNAKQLYGEGVAAPVLKFARLTHEKQLGNDVITMYERR